MESKCNRREHTADVSTHTHIEQRQKKNLWKMRCETALEKWQQLFFRNPLCILFSSKQLRLTHYTKAMQKIQWIDAFDILWVSALLPPFPSWPQLARTHRKTCDKTFVTFFYSNGLKIPAAYNNSSNRIPLCGSYFECIAIGYVTMERNAMHT